MKLLADVHERNASLFPNAPALVFNDRTTTFGEHWRRINQLADGLYRGGAARQDRIAILAMNTPEYVEVYGACERAGFIVTTVNFRLAAPEILYVLNDSAPQALIFEAQYADLVDGLRGDLSVERFICLGGEAPAWAVSYEDVILQGSPEGPPFRARPEDGALLMYTSGTTGRPKGVLRSQWGGPSGGGDGRPVGHDQRMPPASDDALFPRGLTQPVYRCFLEGRGGLHPPELRSSEHPEDD